MEIQMTFTVPDDAGPDMQFLLDIVNQDRVEAGQTPHATVRAFVEGVLQNRLNLLLVEAKKRAVKQELALGNLTSDQIKRIREIVRET